MQHHPFSILMASFSEALQASPIAAMDDFLGGVRRVRTESSAEAWRAFCEDFPVNYPAIWALLQSDPYTLHSMSQPRGYAGDAELIDYIYFQQHQPELCDIGRALFLYNTNAPASSAVRERRDYLARKID